MRKILIALGLVVVTFSGYWAVTAITITRGLEGWFEERRAEGWVADIDDIRTRGYPIAFENRITGIHLADPQSGLAWTAPGLRLRAQSTAPSRWTLEMPDEQVIASPYESIRITSERMESVLDLAPRQNLALQQSETQLSQVTLSAESGGWETVLDRGTLIFEEIDPVEGRAPAYALTFRANGVTPTEDLLRQLDPAGLLPEEIEGLTLDARAAFDKAWDLSAIEVARPQPRWIDLTDLRAEWGELELRAAGEVEIDAEGIPKGRITVKATNWREILDLARNAGVLPEPIFLTVERAFGVLAGMSGPPDTLDATLTFRNGQVRFGPLPLGPAPRIRLR